MRLGIRFRDVRRERWTAVRGSARATVLFTAASLFAFGALSCAGPKELTKQSEKALARGEIDRAYEKARTALRKEPDNEPARQALAAAAERKLGTMKERVRALAAVPDTAAAGRSCLEIEAFRGELAEFRVLPAADSAFDQDAATIRHTAARQLVRRADEEMGSGSPRNAYHQLEGAQDLEAAYPGLEERIREAYAQAVHRIAILPIANQTESRGLNHELTDLVYKEVSDRIRERNFPFTVILPRTEVFSKISLAQAADLDRSEAIEIGRQAGADLIVRGRVYALSTESTSDTWQGAVFRRRADRDSSGRSVDRYDEVPIDVSGRTRSVTVRYEFEIRETRGGALVASRDDPFSAVARVTYTSFHAEGDCDDYTLAPPSMKRSDSRSADSRQRTWREHCGTWELPAFLDRARRGSRRNYKSDMRSEFYSDTKERPVFLGELPPMDELAAVALRGAWEPLVTAIRNLER